MKAIVRGLLTVLTVVVSLGLAGVTPAVAQRGYSCMRLDGLAADRRPNYTCWGSQL